METEKEQRNRKNRGFGVIRRAYWKYPVLTEKTGNRETAVYLAEYLKRKGMETRVQLIDEHHGNVIGVLRGKTEETILLTDIWIRSHMEI